MAIRPITKDQFDSLQKTSKPMARLRVDEEEWFANGTGTLLGAVFFDPTEECWGWVMLTREDQRDFRVLQMDGNLPDVAESRTKLRAIMAQVEERGPEALLA